MVKLMQKNVELKKKVRELNEKLREQPKVGPFGTVKGLRTNPTVVSDESVNPKLAKILEVIAVGKELIVVLANSHAKDKLELQVSTVKRVGIHNYLVVALDDDITNRIWVYNCGFFYIRPTIPAIELLDSVSDRLSKEGGWDQVVFNEVLFYPSHVEYEGLHASKRTMDFYSFMNSRVLFKTVRKDPNLKQFKPVIIHINYHPDKLPRMKAVIEYYVNGKLDALDPFADGTMV